MSLIRPRENKNHKTGPDKMRHYLKTSDNKPNESSPFLKTNNTFL